MENTTKNEVGVSDEIGAEILIQQRKEWKTELDMFQNELEEKTQGLERHNMLWEIDKRLMELQLVDGGLELLRPVYKFQQGEEYAQLVTKQAKAKFEWECVKTQGVVEKMEKSIELIKEQIASLEENIAKNEKQLDEMGAKYD